MSEHVEYSDCMKLFDKEHYSNAIECFKKVNENDSSYIKAWYNRGICHMKLKQLNDAINCFDKVIELDSKNVDALNKKGIAHCQLDEHTKALDSFDKIIGIDSTKYIDALNKKGYIYLDMKKYDKAIKCFEEVLKIDPNNAEALDNKGLYYCHIRDFDNSIEYHNRSLEIKPQYVNALNNKGLAYYYLGKTKHDKVQYKEAIKCYEDAINIDKNNLDVLNNMGNAFLNYDWYDEAIKCFDKVIELDSKNVDAWNNRGYALTTVEKFEQAVNYYDKALEIYSRRFDSTTIHPSIAKIWNNRGNAYANLLKYDRSENGYNYTKAKESYKKAIENDAEFISAYNNDALLDIVEGNLFDKERFYQNAKATLDKLYSKLYSNKEYKNVDIETLDNYGVIYYHLEDYDKALDYFSKANEQDDKSKIIWYHLGRAQTKLKKYKQALSSFDKSLEYDPNFAAAYNGKAIVYHQQKKNNEAADEARKALDINPSLAIVDENLGKLSMLTDKNDSQGFWEFWTSSNSKKSIFLALGLAISIFVSLYVFHIFFGHDVTEIEVSINGKPTNSTKTINQPSEIPETYFIVIVLMVFIILLPEIKKAKVGPMEFELKEEDIHLIRNYPSLPEGRQINEEII